MAYVAAQYVDIRLFHFWKRLIRKRKLWLRNSFSTQLSQLADAFMVVGTTFGTTFLAGGISDREVPVLIGSNYRFRMVVAPLDTGPFCCTVFKLRRYLQLEATYG